MPTVERALVAEHTVSVLFYLVHQCFTLPVRLTDMILQ